MFKNRHVEVKLVEDQTPEAPAPKFVRPIQINPEDITRVGQVAKKTAIVIGAVVAGNRVITTACRIAEIYANK